MDYLLFKSDNGNNYLYSYYNNMVIYLHPLLSELIKLKTSSKLEGWIENLEQEKEHFFKDLGFMPKIEIKKQLDKYTFLKENDFFRDVNIKETIALELNKEIIEYHLANIQHIVFEVTENCNLTCEYCAYGKFYDNFEKRSKHTIKYEDMIAVLDYFERIWNTNKNLSFNHIITISFYGGEPLLMANIIKKVILRARQIEKDTEIKFNYRMTTNGLLISKNIKLLVENDIKISISIDGDKKNNVYRTFNNGKESFDLLLKNIKHLKEDYKKYYKTNVNFISVLHDKNSYADISIFADTVLQKFPSIIELSTVGLKESRVNEFYTKYKSVLSSYGTAVKNDCVQENPVLSNPEASLMFRFIFTHTNYIFSSYNDLLNFTTQKKRLPTGTCIPFERKIFITTNGKILPCERIGQLHTLGKVENQNVYIDCENISATMNRNYQTIKKLCKTCFMFNACEQCIFRTDLERGTANCSYYYNRKKAMDFFSKQLTMFESNDNMYNNIISKSRVI